MVRYNKAVADEMERYRLTLDTIEQIWRHLPDPPTMTPCTFEEFSFLTPVIDEVAEEYRKLEA